ncbi:MAG: glycosyltransferase [Geodermatophilaceae bacterium]|nr:glycosyltransferase [Geodermatophilaceae bacterium]
MSTPLAVVDLDLAGTPFDIGYEMVCRRVPPGHGLRLVLWHRDVPLGDVELSEAGWPVTPARLRQLVAQATAGAVGQALFGSGFDPTLPELRASRAAAQPPPASVLARLHDPLGSLASAATGQRAEPFPPTVSVVICTRDRPRQLERALVAVRALSPAPAEVLVIDNAPRSAASRDVVTRQFSEFRYVEEPRAGLSAARNTGVREASGDIIAFTDDDAEVRPTWVARLQDGFTAPDVMAVTGLVLPAAIETVGQIAFETHLGGFGRGFRTQEFDLAFFRGMRSRGVPVWRIGAGANMAIRRSAFELVGEFDERLGAGAAGCSEDSELWYRLLAEGFRCRYEPAAVVIHHHRADLASVNEQAHAYQRGHVAALFLQFAHYGDGGNLRRALVYMPRFYAGRLIAAAFTLDPIVAAEIRGYLAGLARGSLGLRARQAAVGGRRAARGWFLRRNPFPHPYTEGFYFRDKMRAIHRVSPPGPLRRILEVGGGGSGLTALLYPGADVFTVDLDASLARLENPAGPSRFVCADATRLPFRDGSFDAVTFFDVLEHIADDETAVREAQRVLTPGGAMLVTSPNEHWRFPYHRVFRRICPSDAEVMADWGHVRRGYADSDLDGLVGRPALRRASFINPLTVVNHDVAFSRLPGRLKRVLLAALSPVTWLAYAVHRPGWRGTETATAWRSAPPDVVPAPTVAQTARERSTPVGSGGG